jgi:putative two-component system hydrogenase maturation factor HypX/HoxX
LGAELAGDPVTHQRVTDKKAVRARDEDRKPLAAYRAEELALMKRIFFDPRAPYHRLRSAFVRKEPPTAADGGSHDPRDFRDCGGPGGSGE